MNKIEKYYGKNGIKLYSMNTASNTQVNVSKITLTVRTGSLNDPEKKSGTAHFVEHMNMIFQKSVNAPFSYYRSSYATTTFFETVYSLVFKENELEQILDILSQIVNGTYLVKENIEIIRPDIQEEYYRTIRTSKYKTNKLIYKCSAMEHCFPIGELNVINQIEIDDLLAFHHQWYRLDNMSIQCVGLNDISPLLEWSDRLEAKNRERTQPIRTIENPSFHFVKDNYNHYKIEDDTDSCVKFILRTDYAKGLRNTEGRNGVMLNCMLDIFTDSIYFALSDYLKKDGEDIRCSKCDFSKDIILILITIKFNGEDEKRYLLDCLNHMESLVMHWIGTNFDYLRKQYQMLISSQRNHENLEKDLIMMNLHDCFGRPLYTTAQERECMKQIIGSIRLEKLMDFMSCYLELSETFVVVGDYV